MAKKVRNKRAARKARQEQRKLVEESVPEKAPKKTASKVKDADKVRKGSAQKPSKKAERKKSEAAALQKKAQTSAKSKKDRKQKKSIFKKMVSYFSGVRQELKRVVWPTKRQLLRLTIVVLVVLIVFGVCVWALDTGSSNVVLSYINTFREATVSG